MSLTLRNPHSVIAVLETRPEDVLELRVDAGRAGDAWGHVVTLAERAAVPVTSRQRRGRRPKHALEGRTASAEATVRPRSEVTLAELFQTFSDRHGLWLALEQIQDPHNVGAIFRTAGFFGVRGIVVTSARSAPLSSTVYDVASGGVEYVPFVQHNLQRAIDVAKQTGLWVLGTSEHAELDFGEVDRERNWLLVLGNEERGLRRLALEHCDEVCRLSAPGAVTSLNVSVAAGVFMAGLTSR